MHHVVIAGPGQCGQWASSYREAVTSRATADAIFGDLCQAFERSSQPLPESVAAVRAGETVLWVTAPLTPDDGTRAQLLGLAVPIANADLLLYCADSTVAEGGTAYDALVGIALEFTGGGVTTRLQTRRYREGVDDPVRVRRLDGAIWETPAATVLGPRIDALGASSTLRSDPTARLSAVRTLMACGYELAFSDELDTELTGLVGG